MSIIDLLCLPSILVFVILIYVKLGGFKKDDSNLPK